MEGGIGESFNGGLAGGGNGWDFPEGGGGFERLVVLFRKMIEI